MYYIAKKGNVEYRIERREVDRFVADGCTVFKKDDNGSISVFKAPAGKEDLQNKVKQLESKIAQMRKEAVVKDNQIISLTSDNTRLLAENQKLKAEQVVKKSGSRSKKA